MSEFAASSAPLPPSSRIHWKHVPSDDMDDCEELQLYKNHSECQPLHVALSLLQNSIYEKFSEWDEEALRYQKTYQKTAILAVMFGCFTILVAIFEFILDPSKSKPLAYLKRQQPWRLCCSSDVAHSESSKRNGWRPATRLKT